MPPLPIRPRRLRQSEAIRRLVREHAVSPAHLLIDADPADVTAKGPSLSGFGGLWMSVSNDLVAAAAAVEEARHAAGEEGCLAVDLRACTIEPLEAARRMRAAGADLIAVSGRDCCAVRDGLEADGEVNAIIVACASFPLDVPDAEPSCPAEASDWVSAGADMVLIEPALPNLDRLRAASEALPVPVMARITPQELASYGAAFERGWLDEAKIPGEVLVSVIRAGARVVVVPRAWALAMAESGS